MFSHENTGIMTRKGSLATFEIVGAFVIIIIFSYYSWTLSSENKTLKKLVVTTYSKLKDMTTHKNMFEKKNTLLSNRMVEMEERMTSEKQNADNEQKGRRTCVNKLEELKSDCESADANVKKCEDASLQREKKLLEILKDVELDYIDAKSDADIFVAKIKYIKDMLKRTNIDFRSLQDKYSELEKVKIKMAEDFEELKVKKCSTDKSSRKKIHALTKSQITAKTNASDKDDLILPRKTGSSKKKGSREKILGPLKKKLRLKGKSGNGTAKVNPTKNSVKGDDSHRNAGEPGLKANEKESILPGKTEVGKEDESLDDGSQLKIRKSKSQIDSNSDLAKQDVMKSVTAKESPAKYEEKSRDTAKDTVTKFVPKASKQLTSDSLDKSEESDTQNVDRNQAPLTESIATVVDPSVDTSNAKGQIGDQIVSKEEETVVGDKKEKEKPSDIFSLREQLEPDALDKAKFQASEGKGVVKQTEFRVPLGDAEKDRTAEDEEGNAADKIENQKAAVSERQEENFNAVTPKENNAPLIENGLSKHTATNEEKREEILVDKKEDVPTENQRVDDAVVRKGEKAVGDKDGKAKIPSTHPEQVVPDGNTNGESKQQLPKGEGVHARKIGEEKKDRNDNAENDGNEAPKHGIKKADLQEERDKVMEWKKDMVDKVDNDVNKNGESSELRDGKDTLAGTDVKDSVTDVKDSDLSHQGDKKKNFAAEEDGKENNDNENFVKFR